MDVERRRRLLGAGLILVVSVALAAPWDVVRDELRGKHLALDGLVRGTGRFELERDEGEPLGLRWQAVRARLSGSGGAFRWVLEGQAAPSVRLLDAWVSLHPGRTFRLTVGHHRPPVSREMLTPLQQLVFPDRAVAVRRLAPAWDWGVTISGRARALHWDLGAYASGWLQHPGALPLVAGRVGLDVRLGRSLLQIDVSGAASRDVETPWAGSIFSGDRAVGVLGVQWTTPRWRVGGEVLSAALLSEVVRDEFPIGGYLTLQAFPTRFGSLEARVEGYSRTFTPGLIWEARLGGTLTPIAPLKAKLCYVAPLHRKRGGDHGVELALQVQL